MLDFHQMAAFTAENLVLINPARISGLEPTARAILFHELVHVHQYGALGLETFMHEYIASVVAYRTTAPYRSKASPTRRRAATC